MTNYTELSQQMQEVFQQKTQELYSIFEEMLSKPPFQYADSPAYPQMLQFWDCLKFLQLGIKGIGLENNKDVYEENFICAGIHYFRDFGEMSALLQNKKFLKNLGVAEKEQENFIERIKIIEKELLQGLFLQKEPISHQTLENFITIAENDLMGGVNYQLGFKAAIPLFQIYLINLANIHADENMFNQLEERIFKFNHFIGVNQPADDTDFPASYYNRVLDEFQDLAGLGEIIGDGSGVPKDENLICYFDQILRKTIVARDMKSYSGRFVASNKEKHILYRDGNKFTVEIGVEDGRCYYLGDEGFRDSCLAVISGAGNPIIMEFALPNAHIYTYQQPIRDHSQIDAILYTPSKESLTAPMINYVYENKGPAPYVVYLSQLPGFTPAQGAQYECWSMDIILNQQDLAKPNDAKLGIPADVPAVLIAELVYPDLSKPLNSQARVCKRVIHLVNEKLMDPLAFYAGK